MKGIKQEENDRVRKKMIRQKDDQNPSNKIKRPLYKQREGGAAAEATDKRHRTSEKFNFYFEGSKKNRTELQEKQWEEYRAICGGERKGLNKTSR